MKMACISPAAATVIFSLSVLVVMDLPYLWQRREAPEEEEMSAGSHILMFRAVCRMGHVSSPFCGSDTLTSFAAQEGVPFSVTENHHWHS